jgi:hypothetical protein
VTAARCAATATAAATAATAGVGQIRDRRQGDRQSAREKRDAS